MPYTFTLTTIIPASAQEIYEAWLDSLAHSAMTGGEATMSDEIGAEVSAWDGYIGGRNLELVPGQRIVQSWRTSEFGDEHEDSIVTVTLEEVDEGTLLTLEHANVPDEHKSYEEGGWQENYFEPMAAYFAARKLGAAERSPAKTAPKRSRKAASKRNTAGARKSKRTVRAKSRRTASPKRLSARKKKTKRPVARTSARKRAKPAKGKPGRRKRR